MPQPSSTEKSRAFTLSFSELRITDIPLVGGKNASLGEMYSLLTAKGVRVPPGFAVTSAAYWEFVKDSGLQKRMKEIMKGLDVANVTALRAAGKKVRELILHASIPERVLADVATAYRALCEQTKQKNVSVAVRSSATAEDLPDASFAGQQETYLNIRGEKALLQAVKMCVASLFTDRAISYREAKGFDHFAVALSVGVQQMVRSDIGSSGVMFTLDTESGFRGVTLINAAYGLGEYVVKGRVTPDQFYVFKEGVRQGKKAIISRSVGSKDARLVYTASGSGTKQAPVSAKERGVYSISDDDVIQLAEWGAIIEEHYQKPQDIEWAKDGQTGELYIVQARPETVKTRSNHSVIETYELKKKSDVLAKGIAIGQKIGAGKVRVIDNPAQMKQFKKGEILVTRITDPDWEPIMRIAGAIVTEQGGKTSHAAIVSRELGVPALVGVSKARKVLATGKEVTVSCAEGDEGAVYAGILPFEVKKTEITEVPPTKTKIMMNVGDPDNAFALSFLPNNGVGLAREEFIFTNFIRIHPLALLHYDTLDDPKAKKIIAEMTRGYKDKSAYCVDRLAEGIGRIATAFYPNDVIIRFSDFKTNEYATLIGGKTFEPKEENPMIGWRGASRYYSPEYKEAFGLECQAIKKVRDDWGLTNVITMVPFCRTPEEGQKVIETMQKFGLTQGQNGLQVYVMCEIPSNVILAEEFAKIFDGFSIGSNDLTQLTLGVDRDSALVSHVYNERNDAVKKLIREVIRVAKKYKRKIGICGQAPSDYPEFAEFLVREGIDSISLNPDTVLSTRARISAVEKSLGKSGKKNSGTLTALLLGVAMISATFIGIGAGCGSSTETYTASSLQEISPAALRMQLEKKYEKKLRDRAAVEWTKYTDAILSKATMSYPSGWTVLHDTDIITFEHPLGTSYVEVLRTKNESAELAKINVATTSIANVTAFVFADDSGLGVLDEEVAHIPVDAKDSLEIRSNDKQVFAQFIRSFTFGTTPTVRGTPTGTPVSLGDRMCIQVISYARKSPTDRCEMFSTPCDVPSGYEACDGEDDPEKAFY